MKTEERLLKVYSKAKIKYFDENSKFVLFSDCHRGDDSISDEFTRNQTMMLNALSYYYKNDYTYIELGDGDELWEHINFKHIRAAHTDIFTILKEFYKKNRMIVLYGNHNIFLKNEHYVKKNYYYFFDEYEDKTKLLFKNLQPVEGVILKHRKTGQEILLVHGHQGDLMNDQLWFISMFLLRFFWRFMHLVGFKNPSSPAKNQSKRHKIEKNYTKWIQKYKIMLICGHTHRMKFPKLGQYPYFNTGCCIHTKGITAIEILNDQIMVVQWRVVANEEGVLQVVRKIIRGPEPIRKYQMKKFTKKKSLRFKKNGEKLQSDRRGRGSKYTSYYYKKK